MPHCLSPANCLPLIGRLRRHPCSPESPNLRSRSISISSPQRASSSSHESQSQLRSKLPSTTIQDLDDDSLLHTFHLFRPSMLAVDGFEGSSWNWDNQRWWYKLVQVCRRWRRLILGSASHLRLCLVCTPGTPVADMLANSPPFPLLIGYGVRDHDLTAEDEEGIMLALRHRDRVRFIFLHITVPSLKKLLPAMDDGFPILEYLCIVSPANHDTHLTLPSTFEAPHLRDLWLIHFTSQISYPFLSTATGLVGLSLEWIHPSTYPHPNRFLQQLSLLPQLETLIIGFRSPVPNHDIESLTWQAPITIHVIHPNLRLFDFKGVSDFLEAVLPHMAVPLLETLRVQFPNQRHFSVPNLANFTINAQKLRSSRVDFIFHREAVVLFSFAAVGAALSNFEFTMSCRHLDWQISFAVQVSSVLFPLFSNVVDLTLDYREHTLSSEEHNQANSTQWRKLLGPFRKVETLRLHNGLVGAVSHSLILDGKPTLEILPGLKELICPTRCVENKTFASFIHEREVAGQPVSLIGETFPVGRVHYKFHAATGNTYIDPD